MTSPNKLILIAVGGNSIITHSSKQTVPDQYDAIAETCEHIAPLIKDGNRVVITHGNGPQIGFILRRSEIAATELHLVPFDSAGADTQGALGYQIQQAMHNCTLGWEQQPKVATVVTQVLVDRKDPAFANPSKPIGSFMDAATAKQREEQEGWNIVEDAGRGFRRVVASPLPQEILEFDAIKTLVDQDFVVVAVGGGGIPVIRQESGLLKGVAAVIDKDFATSLLAQQLRANMLVISTAVEQVCLNFGKPEQQTIDRMTVAQAKDYMQQGHFAAGSMLPKIQALVQFLEAGGEQALITDPPNIHRAMNGETGTWLVP